MHTALCHIRYLSPSIAESVIHGVWGNSAEDYFLDCGQDAGQQQLNGKSISYSCNL